MPESVIDDSSDSKSSFSDNLSPLETQHSMLAATPTLADPFICTPPTTMMGSTPSPPFHKIASGFPMGQQLPPTCGARQLSKLKRFLNTLMQFGSDISLDAGERVRRLVLGLVNSTLSIEEFHMQLQEATNFPLRPFVIPFLKANLPLLQRELINCARLTKQSPAQFLANNETAFLLESLPTLAPATSNISFTPFTRHLSPLQNASLIDRPIRSPCIGSLADVNFGTENGIKRRSQENEIADVIKGAPTLKKVALLSPICTNVSGVADTTNKVKQKCSPPTEASSSNRDVRTPSNGTESDTFTASAGAGSSTIRLGDVVSPFFRATHDLNMRFNAASTEQLQLSSSPLQEWRNVDTMLNSILHLVNKTQHAFSNLHDRTRSQTECNEANPVGALRKRDQLAEMRRKAEEAVLDVKRQAFIELQRAVLAAETRASDLLTLEREKMERLLNEERRRLRQEINLQRESIETCCNCGRAASETCSGCNITRYCGSFCQHRDWSRHQKICGYENSGITLTSEGPDGTIEKASTSHIDDEEACLNFCTTKKESIIIDTTPE